MKTGEKYVITIDEVISGKLARAKGFSTLVFDEEGLRKLEPYNGACGETQADGEKRVSLLELAAASADVATDIVGPLEEDAIRFFMATLDKLFERRKVRETIAKVLMDRIASKFFKR